MPSNNGDPETQQLLAKQLSDLATFENRQREQFQRDLHEQQRLIEAKQREYQVGENSIDKLCILVLDCEKSTE